MGLKDNLTKIKNGDTIAINKIIGDFNYRFTENWFTTFITNMAEKGHIDLNHRTIKVYFKIYRKLYTKNEPMRYSLSLREEYSENDYCEYGNDVEWDMLDNLPMDGKLTNAIKNRVFEIVSSFEDIRNLKVDALLCGNVATTFDTTYTIEFDNPLI